MKMYATDGLCIYKWSLEYSDYEIIKDGKGSHSEYFAIIN